MSRLSTIGDMPFLAWVDFHARSRFARSTIPEEKWGTARSPGVNIVLNRIGHFQVPKPSLSK